MWDKIKRPVFVSRFSGYFGSDASTRLLMPAPMQHIVVAVWLPSSVGSILSIKVPCDCGRAFEILKLIEILD